MPSESAEPVESNVHLPVASHDEVNTADGALFTRTTTSWDTEFVPP